MGVKLRISTGEDIRIHPAVTAWEAATSVAIVPRWIDVYREYPSEAIYRLAGVGPGGTDVFAKRTPAARMVIERTIYEEILPCLPLSAPRSYGSRLDEPHGWLFLEDVGLERYSREQPDHLALAAYWVATLHVMAPRIPAARALPDGGPARYRLHLHSARDRIERSLETFEYPRDELDRLHRVLARCAAIEAAWDRVDTACAATPCTLTHGDFQSKNVFLRADGARTAVLPIDWEMTGWGTPAPDLADLYLPRVDLATYWTIVREAWPELSFAAVARLAALGRLLSGCADINWKSLTLLSQSTRGRSSAILKLDNMASLLTGAACATGVLE